jgi:hypothetical protein
MPRIVYSEHASQLWKQMQLMLRSALLWAKEPGYSDDNRRENIQNIIEHFKLAVDLNRDIIRAVLSADMYDHFESELHQFNSADASAFYQKMAPFGQAFEIGIERLPKWLGEKPLIETAELLGVYSSKLSEAVGLGKVAARHEGIKLMVDMASAIAWKGSRRKSPAKKTHTRSTAESASPPNERWFKCNNAKCGGAKFQSPLVNPPCPQCGKGDDVMPLPNSAARSIP